MTCAYCSKEAELTCLTCGAHVCYYEHGRSFPTVVDGVEKVEDYCVACVQKHNQEAS